MKKISNITIRYVKGIEERSFSLDLEPNKIHLLVAPNGFGKSSIATAFAKMNSNRLKLDKKDCYQENESYPSEASITFDGQTLIADRNQNKILDQFKIKVIGSGLISRANRHFQGGVSATMKVAPIDICSIPAKGKFNYNLRLIKQPFGRHRRILPDVKPLFENSRLVQAFDLNSMDKFSQKRNEGKLVQVIGNINQQTGTEDEIIAWIDNNAINAFADIEPLKNLSDEILKLNLADSKTDAYLKAYQILKVFTDNKQSFKASTKTTIRQTEYEQEKEYYRKLLDDFNSSDWKRAELEEDKKNKKLHIVFPDAHQISNGQRDVVTLIVQICEFLYEVSQKPLILIIDEVFDYLDDANLTAFQYYITELIRKYEDKNQAIYPLVLTHLDPEMFSHFSFNSLKVSTHYLQKGDSKPSQGMLSLVRLRDNNENLEDQLGGYWFHYHPNPQNKEICKNANWPTDIPQKWRNATSFQKYVTYEARKYLDGNSKYDLLAVCLAIRIKTEQNVYETLDPDTQAKFLKTRITKKKLQYAASRGNDIPDAYFLLVDIYDTNLHWDNQKDYISPLEAKLNHPIIKNLVKGIMDGSL